MAGPAGAFPASAAIGAAGGLPESVALAVFSRLSVEERLRAREVSRAWRAALETPSEWRDVDTRESAWRHWARVLSVVARLAAGGMSALRVHLPHRTVEDPAPLDALVDAVRANGAALRVVEVGGCRLTLDDARRVLESAARLESFGARCHHGLLNAADATRLAAALGGEGVFAPLRVRDLDIWLGPPAGELGPLLDALGRHRSVRALKVESFVDVAAAVAVAAAAARAGAARFTFDDLSAADVDAGFLTALAPLLAGHPVQELQLLFDGGTRLAGAPELAAAVRGCASLTSLQLRAAVFPPDDTSLLDALVGHTSLRTMDLQFSVAAGQWPDTRPVCDALARLLAARSALVHLSLRDAALEEPELEAVLGGLASPDARLQSLDLSGDNRFDETRFAARVVAPALLRCDSMREVTLNGGDVERHINQLLVAGRE